MPDLPPILQLEREFARASSKWRRGALTPFHASPAKLYRMYPIRGSSAGGLHWRDCFFGRIKSRCQSVGGFGRALTRNAGTMLSVVLSVYPEPPAQAGGSSQV